MTNSITFKQAHAIARKFQQVNAEQGFAHMDNYQVSFVNAFTMPQNEYLPLFTAVEQKELFNVEAPTKKAPKAVRKATKKVVESVGYSIERVDYSTVLSSLVDMEDVDHDTVKALLDLGYDNLEQRAKHGDANAYVRADQAKQLIEDQMTPTSVHVGLMMLLEKRFMGMAWKLVEYGANVKTLEKQLDFSDIAKINAWSNASSQNGKILTSQFEISDIYQEALVKAMTKQVPKGLFKSIGLYFFIMMNRLTNTVRTELRRAKFNANMSDENILLAIDNKRTFQDGKSYKALVEDASQVVAFTKEEKAVLLYRLYGFEKKEINEKLNKRMDRKFISIEKKLHAKTGMTFKQAKAEIKADQKRMVERKQAMKQAQQNQA